MYKLLIINPGSTSTKVAVFQDKEQVFKKNIKHSVEDLLFTFEDGYLRGGGTGVYR